MIARRVVVSGRVQGVYFRHSCRREANQRSVNGWVRNGDDETVRAHFEGEPTAVEALVDWCRTGPPEAQVDAVQIFEHQPEGLRDFRVTQDRRTQDEGVDR